MTFDDKIKDEKPQYDINRKYQKCAKISVLSSGKIDKYEYFTGEEILPSDQRRAIQKAKFTYSPLEKINKNNCRSRRKTKTIQEHGEQLVEYDAFVKKMIMIMIVKKITQQF